MSTRRRSNCIVRFPGGVERRTAGRNKGLACSAMVLREPISIDHPVKVEIIREVGIPLSPTNSERLIIEIPWAHMDIDTDEVSE